MWKYTTSILLVVLLINSSSANTRWYRNQGVANINCPLDDDPDDPTLLTYTGDCTKFLKCSYGLAYTLSCPRGLHFSRDLARCESPSVAMCDGTATTLKPQPGGKGCTYWLKPHSTDCSKFYQCVDGIETELVCAPGSKFDRFNLKCSFLDDVLCL